jgi:hypothetical protein
LTNQGKDAKGLPAAYRVGAWYHTRSRFFDQRFDDAGLSLANPLSTGIPLRHTGDGGVYGVIDQTFYRVPGTDDQGLSGFVRAGGVPNDRNLISFYADGGLLYKGLPSRPDDKVGIAFAYARIGDNARGLDADTGFFGNFFFSGAQRRNDDRDDVSSATETVVDAATRTPIHHPARWRRPQSRKAGSDRTRGSSAFARR